MQLIREWSARRLSDIDTPLNCVRFNLEPQLVLCEREGNKVVLRSRRHHWGSVNNDVAAEMAQPLMVQRLRQTRIALCLNAIALHANVFARYYVCMISCLRDMC
jgi:hypothetical protein